MDIWHLIDAINNLDAMISLDDPALPPSLPRAWWEDLRDRLCTHYNVSLTHNHEARGLGRPGAKKATPQALAALTRAPSFKADHAYLFTNAIMNGLSWASTVEGSDYWNTLHANLPNINGPHPSIAHPAANEGHALVQQEHLTFGIFFPAEVIKRLGPAYRPGQWPHRPPASEGDPTMIRYLPRGKSCVRPVWVTAKLGKWLTTEYPGILPTDEVARLAAKWRSDGKPPPLKLAHTADEIAFIYASGPESCMANGKSVDGIEPVRAYASGDFAVAYIERARKITARCVVHPAAKVAIRIYGDAATLEPILRQEGYRFARMDIGSPRQAAAETLAAQQAINGARLALLRAPNTRPAHRANEEAGEPVAITPFFDLNANAYYDRTADCLRISIGEVLPPNIIGHRLRGGYSLHGIPADVPPRQHASNPSYFYARVGSSGQNTEDAVSYTDARREDLRPTPRQQPARTTVGTNYVYTAFTSTGTVTAR